MEKMNREDFAGHYVDAVLGAIKENHTSGLSDFYDYVFEAASKKTGFTREQLTLVHHPFHWALFTWGSKPPLIMGHSKVRGIDYYIGPRNKNFPLKKEKLVTLILKEHGGIIQEKLDKVYAGLNNQKNSQV